MPTGWTARRDGLRILPHAWGNFVIALNPRNVHCLIDALSRERPTAARLVISSFVKMWAM
jgi:hypothetical protein